MYSVNQYDEIAERYDSLFIDKASIRENEQVARMLRNVKTPVMDIGCGTGLLIDLFSVMNLGYKEVPCIVVDLNEEKARQYRIADNKTSEFATWDEDKLIRELRTMNVPMEMQDFFFESIDQLLGFDVNFSPSSEYEDSTEEDETVTQKEEVSKEEAEAFKEKERKIEDGMKQEATEYIEMKCPHCGEIIRMKK